MKKVLVSDSLAKEGIAILEAAEGIRVDVKTGLKPDELKAIIGDYDALVVRSATKVRADVLDVATNLKVVGRAGIGVDNVDVPAATKKGVIVMNTPAGNIVTTAEHALALLMSLVRRIPQATASMKTGAWEKKAFEGTELCGKVLGVLGLGNIGSIVADRALGLKMRVLAYDPFISAERATTMGVELAGLDELFRRADILTVHVPLVEETRNLVNREAFSKMKRGSYLVCAARGGIVDEAALLEALDNGTLAGAALDVFSQEPPGLTPLVAHDKVICTPHLGASTAEAQLAVSVQVAEQIVDYFATGTIRNAVNIPSVPPEVLEQMRPYLEMARSLGRLQAQLGIEGLRAVEIEYSGKAAEGRTGLLTASALAGLLSSSLGETVNLVNAPVAARERGLKVTESTARNGEDYTALIRLKVEAARGTSTLAGAIFGRREPRIVEIDDIGIEAIPRGHVLVFWNWDKPGLVGSIGTTLGRHSVNIGQLQFGRESAGGKAVTMVNVDSAVDDATLAELRGLPHVISVTKAYL
ncbi:MAG: phosphoglycerate dehydrogenase [Deltaproteobacteria bacterium]|nr:phosphoglycerate dehydrogenase [Deltaproteobacteria bacterium]